MKKEFIESLQFIIICIIGITICCLGLKALDTYERNRALDRCFPYDIAVRYTNQGDKYYTCKK
jgi:hypothetical protein